MTPTNNPAKDFLIYARDNGHLEKLPQVTRQLLERSTNDGVGYQQLAEETGLPLGTVKSRLHRGRAALLKMRGG